MATAWLRKLNCILMICIFQLGNLSILPDIEPDSTAAKEDQDALSPLHRSTEDYQLVSDG